MGREREVVRKEFPLVLPLFAFSCLVQSAGLVLPPANSDEKTVMDTKRFGEILGLRFSLVRSSQFSSSYALGKLFASRNR